MPDQPPTTTPQGELALFADEDLTRLPDAFLEPITDVSRYTSPRSQGRGRSHHV